MTVDSKNQIANDSYNRCIAELRARYRGRGVSNNFKNEIAEIAKKDKAEMSVSSESFVLFNSSNKIADTYRSGEYKGSKYMTSDDFVRYFKSRRAFYMPSALKAQAEEAEAAKKNSAVPKRQGAGSGRGLIRAESDSKEGHIRGLLSVVKAFAQKWFPMESREGRTDVTRFRFPVAAVSGMAVFMLSLGMIVGGSVMVGTSAGDVGELNSEIAVLEAQQTDLQGKLDLKYNISEIEEFATAEGMVKREHADNQYMETLSGPKITIYDESEDESSSFMSTLLSAFGIELD